MYRRTALRAVTALFISLYAGIATSQSVLTDDVNVEPEIIDVKALTLVPERGHSARHPCCLGRIFRCTARRMTPGRRTCC